MEILKLTQITLNCDKPGCGYSVENIEREKACEWINAKCPKCGSNLLTFEDYNNYLLSLEAAAFINSLTEEDLKELSKIETPAEVKEIKGYELLSETNDVAIVVNTHKGVKIGEIKKI